MINSISTCKPGRRPLGQGINTGILIDLDGARNAI